MDISRNKKEESRFINKLTNDIQLLDYNGGLGTLWDTKFSYKSLTV